MKHNPMRILRRTVVLAFCLLCLSISAALAVDATEVKIGGMVLNSASPYWKNGGSAGTAGDWNAYFDTSTSLPTLYLQDAIMTVQSSDGDLLYTNGDARVVLLGDNTILYNDTEPFVIGFYADGDLVIADGTTDGTGTLSITIIPPDIAAEIGGIVTETGNIIIESGTIDITVGPAFLYTSALYTDYDLWMRGGALTLRASGFTADTVYVWGYYQTGGTITAYVDGVDQEVATALVFADALITGGDGWFGATDSGDGYGAVWDSPDFGTFRVLGGHIVFASWEPALLFTTTDTVNPYVSGRIWVSGEQSGAGKYLWNTSMDMLASNDLDDSPYRYVEIEGYGLSQPRTGDGQRPWLWVAIGGAAVLAGGTLLWRMKRRK